jgi:hypothetical protein
MSERRYKVKADEKVLRQQCPGVDLVEPCEWADREKLQQIITDIDVRIAALEDASRRVAVLVEEEMARVGYVPPDGEQDDD